MIPLGVEEVHSSAANGGEPFAIAAECDRAYAWCHGSQRVDLPGRGPQQVRLPQQIQLPRWRLNDPRRHLGFRVPDHDRAVFMQARQVTRPWTPCQLDQPRALRKGALAENLAVGGAYYPHDAAAPRDGKEVPRPNSHVLTGSRGPKDPKS